MEYIKSKLEVSSFKRGDFLLEQGEICKYSSYVIKGCLKTFHTDKKGDEHVVSFAIEDWWAGDLASYITQSPADYSVKCLEDTDLVHVTKPEFDDLAENIPHFERFFMDLTSAAYVSAQKRIVNNLSLTAKERYLKFRKQYPSFEQRFPQYSIASYLGITKEFLSKIRKEITFES